MNNRFVVDRPHVSGLVDAGASIHPSTLAVVALLAIGSVADVATTSIGLSVGLYESNPAVAALLDLGPTVPVLATMKIVASGVALTPLAMDGPRRLRLSGAAVVATMWTAVAAWNAVLIVRVVA